MTSIDAAGAFITRLKKPEIVNGVFQIIFF